MIIKQINQDIKFSGIKFSVGLSVEFFHDEGEKRKQVIGRNHGEQSAVLDLSNVDEFYDNQTAYLQTWIEKLTNTASGLEIDHCIKLYLNIVKYGPLKSSSYISLPEALANKKAIINVQNNDDICLEWALKSALSPAKSNVSNSYSYTKCPNLNMDGIGFPTPISQISKVEKQKNLAINVCGATASPKLEKVNIFPYYISNQLPEKKTRINLLLVTKDVEVEDTNCRGEMDEIYDPEQDYEIDETYHPDAEQQYPEQNIEPIKETKYHYCWIKNLNRLLYDQKQTQRKNILLRPLFVWLHKRRLTHQTQRNK